MSQTDRLIGESLAILEVQEHVSQIAPLTKPVLIVGERGTGKELIASRVHYLSERWGKPFLKLNCAAISDSLLDSELFGHEQGAFSGATRQHKGYFERADGGTLFLDELATVSMNVQEKILRVIEYGEFIRLGSDKVIKVDVRLVAATHGDLPELANDGRFREDLLDRLAFDVITLPPVRSRQEDIPLLADFFALGMIKELKREYFPGFTQEAMKALCNHPWPGNVRELKNVVERSIYRNQEPDEVIHSIIFDPFKSPYSSQKIISESPTSQASTLQASTLQTKSLENHNASTTKSIDQWNDFIHSDADLKSYMVNLEKTLVTHALQTQNNHQKQAANRLGITYHQLRACLRKFK